MTMPYVVLEDVALIPDPVTGEAKTLTDSTDDALIEAAKKIRDIDRECYEAKCAIAHELHSRHGLGKKTLGGHDVTIAQATRWSVRTSEVLYDLHRTGVIALGDVENCVPLKATPDTRALKALQGVLNLSHPDAGRALAGAATVSPPSIRGLSWAP